MNKMIELKKEDIYSGTLILVNKNYPIKKQVCDKLSYIDANFPNIYIRYDAANLIQQIFNKISANNLIAPVSGYRCLQEQTDIYENSLKENGEEFTKKYVALPNHSEHQTGLAIDLGLNNGNIDFIRPYFPYDGICEKFRKTALDYGFIERYKKDKEEITGISHEPWHFRYVGYPHSKIINELELSLEEYIEFIKFYTDKNKFIYSEFSDKKIEIYYVPAKKEKNYIKIPDNSIYQISGNNADGFIVTVWR